MMAVPQAFSGSYAQARRKFLEAATAGGLQLESHPHPLKGRDGELLAMDVARDGAADADKLLKVASRMRALRTYRLDPRLVTICFATMTQKVISEI